MTQKPPTNNYININNVVILALNYTFLFVIDHCIQRLLNQISIQNLLRKEPSFNILK